MKGTLTKAPRRDGFFSRFSSPSEHVFELKPASAGRPAQLVWPKGQITVDSRCSVELKDGDCLIVKRDIEHNEWLVLMGANIDAWERSLRTAIADVRPASAPTATAVLTATPPGRSATAVRSVILEEDIDEDYEPTTDEIQEYAAWLGIQSPQDDDLRWIAREALKVPLPEPWKPCKTNDGEVYYFNFATGESVWDHPRDEYYNKLYKDEKTKKAHGKTGQSKGRRETDLRAEERVLPAATGSELYSAAYHGNVSKFSM